MIKIVNLKELRLSNGFSQEKIAKLINIAQNSYCNIENGKRRPSVQVAKRIAEVLNFDWTLFFKD